MHQTRLGTALLLWTAALMIAGLLPGCGEHGPAAKGFPLITPATPEAPGTTNKAREKPASASPDSVTWTEMQNVHFRLTESVALTIHHLRGRMHSLRKGKPIFFDRPESFLIEIDSAEVGMSSQNLSNLLNEHVFAYEGAPLSDLNITLLGDQIQQGGTMHKAIDVPFELTADITATPEGLIRLRPTDIQVLDIPAAQLMDVFGLSLEGMIDLSEAEGVFAEGNDLIMDPEKILPPPPVRGHLTSIRVEDKELMQIFSPRPSASRPADSLFVPSDPQAPNYMFFRRDTLRFGKLFMVDADMQLVDADPSDPFDFFLRQYKRHLTAGYSQVMPDFGLKVVMPDFEEIDKSTSEGEKLKPSNETSRN